jgi:hypothetical protein
VLAELPRCERDKRPERRDTRRRWEGAARLLHAVEEYRAACRGATIGDALAIRGEEAARSRAQVEAWLRKAKLLT